MSKEIDKRENIARRVALEMRDHFRQPAIGHRAFVEVGADQDDAAAPQPCIHFLAAAAYAAAIRGGDGRKQGVRSMEGLRRGAGRIRTAARLRIPRHRDLRKQDRAASRRTIQE